MPLFNRSLTRKRRQRHAGRFAEVSFLQEEIARRLADRLDDIQRVFPLAAQLGSTGNSLQTTASQGKIGKIFTLDSCAAFAPDILGDEEALPFAAASLDAIFSVNGLHWVNDLPGTLIQARRALKPDGLFLAALPGARTLVELRQAMLQADAAKGKASARVSPFIEVRDGGALLQRAGFALPVVDSEFIPLTYRDFPTLLRELQWMGESNALTEQFKGLTPASYWQQVEAAYPRTTEGLFPVTVEVVYLTGWAPHESQQQPARRGSGKISLTAVL